jgi:hypothetical protein
LDLAFSWSGTCRPTASLAFVGPSGQKGTVVNLKSASDEQSVVDAITQALP